MSMGTYLTKLGLFFVGAMFALPAQADLFYVNFRSEIGPLPKTAKQKLNKEYDFQFNAVNWDEAIHTGMTWLGSERQTSHGSSVIITGVEIREAEGRGRGCVLGDMVVRGMQACPKPKWKGSPVLEKRRPAGVR